MVEVQIKLEGGDKVIRKLKRMGIELNDFSEEMRAIGKYYQNFVTVDVFEDEGGPYGNQWAPLNEAYEDAKREEYPGAGILERTGKMRRNFKTKISPNSMIFYNPTKYFKYHQSSKPRKKLPRRVMINLDAERRMEITRIMGQTLNKRLKRALR